MKKIVPFLWFEKKAEDAAKFYVSLFKNSKITQTTYFEDDLAAKYSHAKKGDVMLVSFRLNGQDFQAINGGPGVFKPSGVISFYVNCKDQKEVDFLWKKLSKGGKIIQCGWLTDRFGITWQIIPEALPKLLSKDTSGRVMNAMMQMKKIDVKKLENAFRGK